MKDSLLNLNVYDWIYGDQLSGTRMKINKKSDFTNISFLDHKAGKITIDMLDNSIIFSVMGGCYLLHQKKRMFGEGFFKISSFSKLSITSFSALTGETVSVSVSRVEDLGEICEIDVCDDRLVIKGFARDSRNWLTFDILGGAASGSFNESSVADG